MTASRRTVGTLQRRTVAFCGKKTDLPRHSHKKFPTPHLRYRYQRNSRGPSEGRFLRFKEQEKLTSSHSLKMSNSSLTIRVSSLDFRMRVSPDMQNPTVAPTLSFFLRKSERRKQLVLTQLKATQPVS